MDPKRYFPAVAVGGAAAGAAIAIPILGDILRCCMCVGVMAGAGASMKLWLDAHPAESLTATEGMVLGACSGAITAAVSWLLSIPIRLAFGLGLSSFYDEASFLPELARSNLHALYTPSAGMIVMSLPLQGAIYGVMGGVGGFIALHTAFKSRLQAE